MNDLHSSLGELGVERGSGVLVHSSFALAFNQSNSVTPDRVLQALEDLVGPNGALLFPSFTYSFPKGEKYARDNRASVSKMGVLPLAAFDAGYFRSRDPIFSFLMSQPIFRGTPLEPDSDKSFGRGSTIQKIIDLDFLILNLGVHPLSTILHDLELQAAVPYRKEKDFTGTILHDSKATRIQWTSYVRDLSLQSSELNILKVRPIIEKLESFRSLNMGRYPSCSYRALEARESIVPALLGDPLSLL